MKKILMVLFAVLFVGMTIVGCGGGGGSSSGSSTPAPTGPLAASALVVDYTYEYDANSDIYSTLSFAFNDNSTNETSFTAEFQSVTATTWTNVLTITGDVVTGTNAGVAEVVFDPEGGKLRIKATNANGSTYSNVVTLGVLADEPPNFDLTVTDNGDGTWDLDFTWDDSDIETGYTIEQYNSATDEWDTLDDTISANEISSSYSANSDPSGEIFRIGADNNWGTNYTDELLIP